jgi:hypothetical protein
MSNIDMLGRSLSFTFDATPSKQSSSEESRYWYCNAHSNLDNTGTVIFILG